MIIYMSRICITNRHLVSGDFLSWVEQVTSREIWALILREKDLTPEAYGDLALAVRRICRPKGRLCIYHYFVEVALVQKAEALHLPLPVLRRQPQAVRQKFRILGTSCHSAAEAVEAQQLGATYLTLSPIFCTACKPGVPALGLTALRQVKQAVTIPVYALGGVTESNEPDCLAAGAAGVAMMSAYAACGRLR